MRLVAEDVARVEVPVTASVPPTEELPVEVIVVNDGVAVIPIVDVPEKTTLDPAIRYDTGVL